MHRCRILHWLVFPLTFCSWSSLAQSQDLTYQPINPAFGGNPLNSNILISTANAQRTATARDADDGSGSGGASGATETASQNADLFVRQLQSRLFSALASQVTEAIFGDEPAASGTVTFGTTNVEFSQTATDITLVITDNLAGTVTEVVVPQLISD